MPEVLTFEDIPKTGTSQEGAVSFDDVPFDKGRIAERSVKRAATTFVLDPVAQALPGANLVGLIDQGKSRDIARDIQSGLGPPETKTEQFAGLTGELPGQLALLALFSQLAAPIGAAARGKALTGVGKPLADLSGKTGAGAKAARSALAATPRFAERAGSLIPAFAATGSTREAATRSSLGQPLDPVEIAKAGAREVPFAAGLSVAGGAATLPRRVLGGAAFGGGVAAAQGGDPADIAFNASLIGIFELLGGRRVSDAQKARAINDLEKSMADFAVAKSIPKGTNPQQVEASRRGFRLEARRRLTEDAIRLTGERDPNTALKKALESPETLVSSIERQAALLQQDIASGRVRPQSGPQRSGPPAIESTAVGNKGTPPAPFPGQRTGALSQERRQVLIDQAGGPESQTRFGAVKDLSDQDLLRIAREPVQEPTVQPRSVPREIDPTEREIIDEMKSQIESGEAGGTLVRDPSTGEVTGRTASTFPDFFKNKGLTKKATVNMLNRVLEGKPITAGQKAVFNDLLDSKIKEVEDAIDREKLRLSAEGVPQPEIDSALQSGEAAEGPAVPESATEFQFGENIPVQPKIPPVTEVGALPQEEAQIKPAGNFPAERAGRLLIANNAKNVKNMSDFVLNSFKDELEQAVQGISPPNEVLSNDLRRAFRIVKKESAARKKVSKAGPRKPAPRLSGSFSGSVAGESGGFGDEIEVPTEDDFAVKEARLAGSKFIKPLQAPEIVRLARVVTEGATNIKVASIPKSLGLFYSNFGRIKIDPVVFMTPEGVQKALDDAAALESDGKKLPTSLRKTVSRIKQVFGSRIETGPDGGLRVKEEFLERGSFGIAERVLAHEIGHLIDWIPDNTLKRGNLIGRAISSVRQFMKKEFEELKNPELKDELKKLTQFWKPFDEAAVPPSFLAYRYSARELYADFLSVLLNAPTKAKELAPKFYDAFWSRLHNKPEALKALIDLQDLVLGTDDDLLRARENDIKNMFEKGEQIFAQKKLQSEARRKSIWFLIKYAVVDKNIALLEKRDFVAARRPIEPDADPRYVLEEHATISTFIKSHLDDFDRLVYKPLVEEGFDWAQDFGQVLFLQRVFGERKDLANPLGQTSQTAKQQLEFMKSRLGEERFDRLNELVFKMRDWFKGINNLFKKDLLTPEQIQRVESNQVYAPFQVLDFLDEYVSAGIVHQVGTLKEIANPAVSMVLKSVSMLRAYERNRINKVNGEFVVNNFPSEVEEARVINRPGVPFSIPQKAEFGTIKWKDKGKWKAFHVDPFIADSFKSDTTGTLQLIGDVIGKVTFNNVIFRPLYITFNVGFQAVNFIRDFRRFYKNSPNMTLTKALLAYKEALPPSFRRIAGKFDPVIRQMEREKALNPTFNNLILGQTSEDKEIETLLQRFSVMDSRPVGLALLKPIVTVLDGIRFIGDVVETIPKVAGFKSLDNMNKTERSAFVRNFVGTPNFKRKGKAYAIYNNVFLFSNIIKEGLRGDFYIALKNPKTRSGFWWKTVKLDILPKVAMFLAAAGFFGKALKDGMDSATEYDKTNYTILPIGEDENGQVIYLRIPHDETGRLLGGIFWKIVNAKENGIKTFGQLLSFTGQQIPSPAPLFDISKVWFDFLTGRPPRDEWRGRDILTEDEMKAGGMDALQPMVAWTINQSGQIRVDVRDRLKEESIFKKTMGVLPIFNRFVRVTNFGQQENLSRGLRDQQAIEARERIRFKENVRQAVREGKSGFQARNRKEATKIRKSIQRERARAGGDVVTQLILRSSSNMQKARVLVDSRDRFENRGDFERFMLSLRRRGLISNRVVFEVRRSLLKR